MLWESKQETSCSWPVNEPLRYDLSKPAMSKNSLKKFSAISINFIFFYAIELWKISSESSFSRCLWISYDWLSSSLHIRILWPISKQTILWFPLEWRFLRCSDSFLVLSCEWCPINMEEDPYCWSLSCLPFWVMWSSHCHEISISISWRGLSPVWLQGISEPFNPSSAISRQITKSVLQISDCSARCLVSGLSSVLRLEVGY